MSTHRRRYSKRELLGSLQVDYVMSVHDLGLASETNRWEVLRAFLRVGEARAEQLIEDDGGFLLLQSVPGRANTGAIYVYNESLKAFFWLRFEHKEDTLNSADFHDALRIYKLLKFTKSATHDESQRKRRRNRRVRHARKGAALFAAPACTAALSDAVSAG
jgi:hypothetical protein